MRAIGGGQYGMHQFFGSGFPVASGDGEHGNGKLLPMVEGELLQGFQHIFHQQGLFIKVKFFFIDDGEGRAIGKGLPGKSIAVEVGPFEGEENAPLDYVAGIGTYARSLF